MLQNLFRLTLLLFFFYAQAIHAQDTEAVNTNQNSNITQDSSVNPNRNDTLNESHWANHKFSKRDIQKIIKAIKYSREVYQMVKRDYSSLFEMNGYHPYMGYSYQGVSLYYLGLGYGKRNLFKPSAYSNLHAGITLTPSKEFEPNIGLNIGYSKSKLFTFWGIESELLRKPDNQTTLVIRPELGLTVIGTFQIGYGYGFDLGNAADALGGHTFIVRYTHQFLQKNIKRKVAEFNYVFKRDYRRLQEMGLDLLK